MTSASRCAGLARWWVEMLMAREGEHRVGRHCAGDAAGELGGDVGERVAPGESAEVRVDQRDDRVEVPAGDGAEHEDDREQAGSGGRGVLEQREPGVVGRELARGDAGADHDGREERGAEVLGEQPAGERRAVGHRASSPARRRTRSAISSRMRRTPSRSAWAGSSSSQSS